MKFYELTFMDIERGKIRRWKRNKIEIDRFVERWAKRYPMRKLLTTEVVEIPTNFRGLVLKQTMIDWLNENCGGD